MDAGSTGNAAAPLVPVCVNTYQGRVGTTLMMQLLGTAPDVVFDRAPPYERRHLTWLLRDLVAIEASGISTRFRLAPERGEVVDLDHPQPQVADWDDYWPAFVRHTWDAFSAAAHVLHPHARFYAEKAFDARLDLLDMAGVEWRCIELVRDPRDMFASILAFDDKRGYAGFGREDEMSDRDYMFATVRQLKQVMPLFGQARDNTILVRYEDLAADLAGVASRIGTWLGTTLDADAVLGNRTSFAGHTTTSSASSSVGRWRTDLDPVTAAYITDSLRSELERFGYEI